MGPSQQLASSKCKLSECGTARTFRLTVSLKRERHNLCSCCAHRTIYNGYNDLLHLLPGMHVLVVAGQVYPHCHFDMYPSFMSPPARSNPYRILHPQAEA